MRGGGGAFESVCLEAWDVKSNYGRSAAIIQADVSKLKLVHIGHPIRVLVGQHTSIGQL